MNVLLDTHVALWCIYDPEKLSPKAREIVRDPDNWIYYSQISLWECEIKHNKHPDVFPFDSATVRDDCFAAGYSQLNLQSRHIFALKHVGKPREIKHDDPFDKMLMSQACSDNMIFLTHDKRLAAYGINNIVVI